MTAAGLLRSRPSIVWAALFLASLLSFWLGTDHGFSGEDGRRLGTSIVLGVAFLKVRWIGLDFMELRHAPLPLRLTFELWCAGVACAVIALYLAG